jgi:hypothetical protein
LTAAASAAAGTPPAPSADHAVAAVAAARGVARVVETGRLRAGRKVAREKAKHPRWEGSWQRTRMARWGRTMERRVGGKVIMREGTDLVLLSSSCRPQLARHRPCYCLIVVGAKKGPGDVLPSLAIARPPPLPPLPGPCLVAGTGTGCAARHHWKGRGQGRGRCFCWVATADGSG